MPNYVKNFFLCLILFISICYIASAANYSSETRPTIRILPYHLYESDSERLTDKAQGIASAIDVENTEEMKGEFEKGVISGTTSSGLDSEFKSPSIVSCSLISDVDSSIDSLSTRKAAVSISETSGHRPLNYSDNHGNGTIFTEAFHDDISQEILQEGREILETIRNYVSLKVSNQPTPSFSNL